MLYGVMSQETSPPGEAVSGNDTEPEKSTECRYCDRDFESYAARRKHEGISHSEPYQERDTLARLYHEEQMSMEAIAERFEVSPNTIRYWIDENDIETRGVHEHHARKTANLALDTRGYLMWSTYVGDNNQHVLEHRLLAVAEYGFDAVTDKVVHHKNNIGWDNRPENIELMTAAEHASHHHGN